MKNITFSKKENSFHSTENKNKLKFFLFNNSSVSFEIEDNTDNIAIYKILDYSNSEKIAFFTKYKLNSCFIERHYNSYYSSDADLIIECSNDKKITIRNVWYAHVEIDVIENLYNEEIINLKKLPTPALTPNKKGYGTLTNNLNKNENSIQKK